jgi:hypothetical protein
MPSKRYAIVSFVVDYDKIDDVDDYDGAVVVGDDDDLHN